MEKLNVHSLKSTPGYSLKLARVYKVMGQYADSDDRLQVQVLPDLEGIPKKEMENLPKYPPLIRGQVITARGSYSNESTAEFVWCAVSDQDIEVGFVIGLANMCFDDQSASEQSLNFEEIRKYFDQRGVLPDNFSFQNMEVLNWHYTPLGGIVQCLDRATGTYFVLNTTGACMLLSQDKIFMRVGSPSQDGGKTNFSAITMTTGEINFKTPNFVVDAQNVSLGMHGMKVLGTISSLPHVSKDGSSIIPIPNITC